MYEVGEESKDTNERGANHARFAKVRDVFSPASVNRGCGGAVCDKSDGREKSKKVKRPIVSVSSMRVMLDTPWEKFLVPY